jgi:hypothetical protein
MIGYHQGPCVKFTVNPVYSIMYYFKFCLVMMMKFCLVKGLRMQIISPEFVCQSVRLIRCVPGPASRSFDGHEPAEEQQLKENNEGKIFLPFQDENHHPSICNNNYISSTRYNNTSFVPNNNLLLQ